MSFEKIVRPKSNWMAPCARKHMSYNVPWSPTLPMPPSVQCQSLLIYYSWWFDGTLTWEFSGRNYYWEWSLKFNRNKKIQKIGLPLRRRTIDWRFAIMEGTAPPLPKPVVKSSTMPPSLIQEVISCSVNAIEENTTDKSIAASIRKAIHSKHPTATWNCFVGRDLVSTWHSVPLRISASNNWKLISNSIVASSSMHWNDNRLAMLLIWRVSS